MVLKVKENSNNKFLLLDLGVLPEHVLSSRHLCDISALWHKYLRLHRHFFLLLTINIVSIVIIIIIDL